MKSVSANRHLGFALVAVGLSFVLPAISSAATATATRESKSAAASALAVETVTPNSANLTAPLTTLRGESYFDELTFTFGQENYLNKATAPVGASAYTQIASRLRARTHSKPLSGMLEIGGSFATDVESYSNIEVPEAHLVWEKHSEEESPLRARVIIGRKRERWNALDSDFMVGVIQPMNRFDALRPSEQGLTGAFAGIGYGIVDATIFSSSTYIPEQGAPYQLQNGKFQTNSPWFSTPPENLELTVGSSSQLTPVKYAVEIPSIGSVINHPSFGGQLRFASPGGTGFYLQGSFFYKPQNTIALPFTGKLRLTDSSSYGDVVVYPEVVYHKVTAGDVGYTSRVFSAGVSALRETPDDPQMKSDLTYQKLEPMTMISPSMEVRFFPRRFWGPRLKLAYLTTTGGGQTSVGPMASNGNVFGSRTMFREATSLSLQTVLLRMGGYQVDHGLRWIEEHSENGTVVMADVRVLVGEAWRITLSGDMLGSRTPSSKTDTFISRFRGNDRFAGRVTYIF